LVLGDSGSRIAELGSRISELGTGNSELGTRNSELGTRDSELGSRNWELGSRISELGSRIADRGSPEQGTSTPPSPPSGFHTESRPRPARPQTHKDKGATAFRAGGPGDGSSGFQAAGAEVTEVPGKNGLGVAVVASNLGSGAISGRSNR
jgi:hypothetical protein